MLPILVFIAHLSAPPIPSDGAIAVAWRDHARDCEQDLGLKGPPPRALGLLAGRGIRTPAARYVLLACASRARALLATALMRAALQVGPLAPVSVEIRKMISPLTFHDQPTAEQRELARELSEPERIFAEALIDDGPAPIAKLEAALAAVPADAPEAARNERRVCLAGALARAGKLDEALAASPAASTYPPWRKAIEAQIAARGGDAERAKQLLHEMSSLGEADDVPCRRVLEKPQCPVVRRLIAAGQLQASRDVSGDDCGARAAWAEEHQSPFDAYLTLIEARSSTDYSTVDGLIRGPRLLAKLGHPELARQRLRRSLRECADTGKRRRPTGAICGEIQKFVASLPAIAPQSTDAGLLARLGTPALWRAYQVVPAPPGKPAGLKKALALPAGARVVFSAAEGTRAVAVALLRAVDPRGEVSSGGYVVYLSDDGGKSWRGPLHTGFAAGFPFFVKGTTTAKAFDGDVLQVPVDIEETDPDSIDFPPVNLRRLRQERDRLVRIPIASLEKDSDGDGLPDLLEERLGTDPNRADSDGDGVPDALDPMPLEQSGRDASSDGRFAAAFLDGFDDDEEWRVPEDSESSDGPVELPARQPAPAGTPSLRTYFIEGGSRVTGLGARTIRLSPEAEKAYGTKFGPIFPTRIESIVEPGGHRAIIEVNWQWHGDTSVVEERPDGTFTVRILSGWIS